MMKICTCVVLLLSISFPAFSEAPAAGDPGFGVTGRVDWPAGIISVEVTRALDPATASLLRAKSDAETDIDARLSDLLSRVISPVQVDSSHAFGDLLQADAALYARVNELALGARRTELFLSKDFKTLVARYAVPLFGDAGIVSPLYPTNPAPFRRSLGDVTTRAYTGLIIFASGALPAAGSARAKTARPAVFPRIWDEQMNLVMDKDMCNPEALARWGMVGYAAGLDDAAAELRAGALPLRLSARGVFGDSPTDLIISSEGARRLLALPENLAFLREGRVVIIYDQLSGNGPS
jgi:hypothetical protein